jgi:hypothetical protein
MVKETQDTASDVTEKFLFHPAGTLAALSLLSMEKILAGGLRGQRRACCRRETRL